ncbi:E3 ubiquitin-protein ligase RNF14 isoform X1 [Xenopus tropicalis]|uniref:E3 ubiquitin-protein ligase RNF14 n=2 Tax=Xenopus tropicalis TaxID=8364 RepID=A0A8J1JCC1_XENTR|nr:E3 ubiquitin-protein ligase RNF14 isoform X1 [Xenopus tropicalis]
MFCDAAALTASSGCSSSTRLAERRDLHRQPMSREDKEAQEDELLALASIYSEDEFKRSETAPGGEICVCLDLPPNFSVAIKGDCASNEYMGSFEDIVSFLPPIILDFELPPGYPSTDPPAFKLSCKWLSPSQLALLCQRLENLWEEYAGGVVLFAWMQFLKEGTLEYLKINSPYEIQLCEFGPKCIRNNSGISDSCSATGPAEAVIWDKRAIQDVESVAALIDCILDFNEAQQKKCFDSKWYMCNICFSEKVGSECTHFKKCEHIYCNACLKDYYTVQIQDGQVQALNCPEPKCSSVATPAQVKLLVGEELFSRYDRLLLQSSLDLMADVVYCPLLNCQTPVMLEPGGTMGICSNCNYAFCTLCKMVYHGVAGCNITTEKLVEEDLEEDQDEKLFEEDLEEDQDEKLVEEDLEEDHDVFTPEKLILVREEYLEADAAGKKLLEKRYGKHKILKAVERKSTEWLETNTQQCPNCNASIQKDGGCNKMICRKCNKDFCWLCFAVLSTENPYDHFKDISSGCFNQM